MEQAPRAISPGKRITELLSRMLHHPCAPKWNHVAGDELGDDDLTALRDFRRRLDGESASCGLVPGPEILDWTADLLRRSPFFGHTIKDHRRLASRWHEIPTTSREDVVRHLDQIVPLDAPLGKMRIYRTAGTTGHPVSIPHSSLSVGAYHAFLDHVLSRCGIGASLNSARTAGFLIGAQQRTVTYATALSYWSDAAFAKINIDSGQWRRPFDSEVFISDFKPHFLTGDPISFSRLLELDLDIAPAALITTAVAMADGLRDLLTARFGCPVIDWYSLTETGPIAFKAPGTGSYRIMASDLFVECVDVNGFPVLPGEIGEVTLTGGRNPFLPLVRYRTGDFGRLVVTRAGERFLEGLEGRKPVMFRKADGSRVNSVDIAGCIQPHPVVQYEFSQRKSLRCSLEIRTARQDDATWLIPLRESLGTLFGDPDLIEVRINQELGQRSTGGKVLPYRSELPLEE